MITRTAISQLPRTFTAASSPLLSIRCAHQTANLSAIPKPTPFVPDVTTFLRLIGRDCGQFAAKIKTWDILFGSSSAQLRALGVEPPRTRRYLLHWRDRFRRGEYGPWGHLQHVTEGAAELRVAPGGRRVVNTPLASADAPAPPTAEIASSASLPADAADVSEARVAFPGVVAGPHCQPLKGTGGAVARVNITEGMWELRRGHKVGGGERLRRRARALLTRRRRGINAM